MAVPISPFRRYLQHPKALSKSNLVNAPITTQGNMFTYLFGPVVRFPISRVAPFGELLFGGSNSNGYANQIKGFATTSHAFHPLQTSAAPNTLSPWRLGGGLDIKVSTNFSIRPIEIDYILTRYTNR